MHDRLWCIVTLVIVTFFSKTIALGWNFRLPASRGFLLYRTNSISQRPCTCSTNVSCSCCETVTLIYSKERKKLCSNFTYQRNGLNVDISLNTDIVKSTTVTVYRPFKLCSAIPGSLFSSICVNVLELNQFPRSLTVCVRHEIVSKAQEWQIDYTCVSISTELPSMGNNIMASMMMTTSAMAAGTTMKPSSSITMATAAPPMMMSTAAPPMMMSTAAPPMMMTTAAPSMMMTSIATSTGSGGMSSGPPPGGQLVSMGPGPPPGGQMVSMRPGPPSSGGQMGQAPSAPGGSGTPASIGIEPARKRRHALIKIGSMSPGQLSGNQISSMISTTISNEASSVNSRSIIIGGTGKRQYALNHKFYKILINNRHDRRARIVNDKIEIPNLHCKDTKNAKNDGLPVSLNSPAILNLSTNMTTSGTTKGFSIQSNERPVTPDAEGLHDRTQYFPSRIPPVVAKALQDKSIINPYITSLDESSNKFSSNGETDVVIFPN